MSVAVHGGIAPEPTRFLDFQAAQTGLHAVHTGPYVVRARDLGSGHRPARLARA